MYEDSVCIKGRAGDIVNLSLLYYPLRSICKPMFTRWKAIQWAVIVRVFLFLSKYEQLCNTFYVHCQFCSTHFYICNYTVIQCTILYNLYSKKALETVLYIYAAWKIILMKCNKVIFIHILWVHNIFIVVLPCMVNVNTSFPCFTVCVN